MTQIETFKLLSPPRCVSEKEIQKSPPPAELAAQAHQVQPAENSSSMAHSLHTHTHPKTAILLAVAIGDERQTRQTGGGHWFQGVAYKLHMLRKRTCVERLG